MRPDWDPQLQFFRYPGLKRCAQMREARGLLAFENRSPIGRRAAEDEKHDSCIVGWHHWGVNQVLSMTSRQFPIRAYKLQHPRLYERAITLVRDRLELETTYVPALGHAFLMFDTAFRV
jgi:hypothetical protein